MTITRCFSPLITTLGLVGLSTVVQAQTLPETIALAKNYQSEQRLAGLQIEDQVAQLEQIRAQYGPRLTATAELGIGYIDTEKNALFPEQGKRVPQNLGLQFSYPLYTGGRQQLALAAAQTGTDAARANAQYVENQTILAAINLHAAITRDQALLQLERDQQLALDRAQHDAALRLKAGEVTKTDLAQATARQAKGIANQRRAEANLQIDQSNYLQLTGQQAHDISALNTVPAVPNSLEEAKQQLAQTPLLESARLQIKAASQQLDLAKHQNYPTLQLAGRASSQKGSDFSKDQIGAYGVSLQASLPLLDGGTRHAETLRAQSKLAIAQEQLEQLSRQKQQSLAQNYATLQASKAEYAALIQARDAAALALNTIQRELELGTRTTFDLLTAQQDLLDANTQLILNREQQALSAYQILADINQLQNF